jgi:prephenate dehydrogenase
MKKPVFKTTVVIGLGLIGSSLARDLKAKKLTRRVCGFDTVKSHIKEARRLKIIEAKTRTLKAALAEADLVILAAPVRAIKEWIRKHAADVSEKALVIDVGSTKTAILQAALAAFPHGNFVGCHPLAGTEKSGPTASDKNLFKGKTCFLVKTWRTTPEFFHKAEALWKAVGAVPRTILARQHDEMMALVSHFPQFVSSALMHAAASSDSKLSFLSFVGSGFKDSTRIAASPAHMWVDIFLENATSVLQVLRILKSELNVWSRALEQKDETVLFDFLQRASSVRKKIS